MPTPDEFEMANGYGFDYAMVLPTAKLKSPKGIPTLTGSGKDVLKKIRAAGLETYCYLSVGMDEVIVEIGLPLARAREYADQVNMRMLLDEGALKEYCSLGDKERGVAKIEIAHHPGITPRRPPGFGYIHV